MDMALKFGSSFSCLAPSLSSHSQLRRGSQLSLFQAQYGSQQNNAQQLRYAKGKSCAFPHQIQKSNKKIPNSQSVLFAVSEDQSQDGQTMPDVLEQENGPPNSDISPASNSYFLFHGTGGKPASFIFPSLYLRKLILTIFEDSLLTDFLILFFTEALFYCGVAVFLLLIDKLRRPTELESAVYSNRTLAPQLGQRISSVAALALSLIIPMVTMGYVWPWTGPAASATLAPYLVGIVVQFAFEQYARYKKSPSWPAIPVIFQVYRLHQLNRAAQLVTALSFTVKGAEMTSQNLAINSSLGTLLNVLQCLGVICIWSLSSFLMKYFSSTTSTAQ